MNSDLLPVFFCNGAADPKLWALILLSSVRWKNHLAAIQLCHSLTKPRKGDWHNGEIFIMVFFPAVIFFDGLHMHRNHSLTKTCEYVQD